MDRYVIKKEEIAQYEGVSKQHFLNDQVQRVNKSLGDLTGISGFGFHVVEVPPGKWSTEFHVHGYEDECVYILEGEAQVTIGDQLYEVRSGDPVRGKPRRSGWERIARTA